MTPDPVAIADALRGAGEPVDPARLALTRIAADRGLTGTLWRVDRDGEPAYVLKRAAPEQFERAVREARVLRDCAAALPIPVPELLHAATDDTTAESALLLRWIDGRDGDVLAPEPPAQLGALLDDLAALHRSGGAFVEAWSWLPRWGRGTANAARPHRRRAARAQRNGARFIARFDVSPAFAAEITAITDDFEADLDAIAARIETPITIIHADVHLDNVRFDRTERAVWLDWQSASRGPGLYDVARLLLETTPRGDGPLRASLLDRYLDALGATARDAAALRAQWPAFQRRVIAGFVSGYGGRDDAQLSPRDRAMIAQFIAFNDPGA